MEQAKIGKLIAKRRKELKMTQEELANKLHVTNKTISRWENGNYMPDLSIIVELSNILNISTYELLTGEIKQTTSNIETETRILFSLSEEEKIIDYLKGIKNLEYKGKFYEKTTQYNHPDKSMDFYSKQIDARFRVRVSKNDFNSKCMISYKRRKENFFKEDINNEEEVEVSVDYKDLDNLTYILEEVLKMNLVESYERYRYVFYNQDIEIDVDVYPFMIALEIENKSVNKEPNLVVMYYLERLGFSIDDTYKLSWDDKYEELCKQQNIEVYKMVTFDKKMPEFNGFIFKNK